MPWWAQDEIRRHPEMKPHLEAAFKDWKPSNADKRRERLYAAKLIGTHSDFEWIALRSLFDGCVLCGSRPVQKDHIVPIYQADGCDCIANIQPLCRLCNNSKGPERIDYRSLSNPGWMKQYLAIMEMLGGNVP